MFQTKVIQKIKTHILCSITFSRKSCRLWDIVEKYGTARQTTDDNIIRRMRFTCWITKATDTHWEYVILIAFPLQQWLRESASVLRYTYTASLVHTCVLQCVTFDISLQNTEPEHNLNNSTVLEPPCRWFKLPPCLTKHHALKTYAEAWEGKDSRV
jgi:hypothetical protein